MEIATGDTAWVMISAALVLLMTPALALFYGGMVRAKSALNMIMMSIITMGIVGVLWVLFGFSMVFGESFGGLIGNPLAYLGLGKLMTPNAVIAGVPILAFVGFQSAFAIIAAALISGAVADRMKFSAWVVFTAIWTVVAYFPAAHWVFSFDNTISAHGGFIANKIGAIDFAGGTAIHINAGVAALVLAMVVGPRLGYRRIPMRPHNLTMVMTGAAILWFGWFGFNAGSALAANQVAALAWVNTLAAPAAAMLAWLTVEKIRDGNATTLGAASGIVAGLVGITPAANAVSPLGAIAIGVLAGVACAIAVGLKHRFRVDDSLDVVGVHLVGGLVGTLAIGFFADPNTPAKKAGLLYGGGFHVLSAQAQGAGIVLVYSAVVTFVIAKLISLVMPLRVSAEVEGGGIDVGEHAETAYDFSQVGYASQHVRHSIIIPTEALEKADTQ